MTESKFRVGQKVVIVTTGSYGTKDVLTPAVVETISKTGVVKVSYPQVDGYRSFNPDCYERGKGDWGRSSRIRPLADGETHESILAANDAAFKAGMDAADKKRREKLETVAEWWGEQGEALWAKAVSIAGTGPFDGLDIRVIQYQRGEECFMPLVMARQEHQDWDGKDVWALQVGGLAASVHAREDKERLSASINTFSRMNSGRYDTLEEALYDVTH